MNKTKFLSLTASLVLATTLTLSCEDKEKDKPATVAETASTAETATPATPPETAEKTVPDKRETFTDSRDGKTYKKVTIGSQTWMAENLNFAAKGSLCYDNKPENCEKYGRLYNWETAMKACPSGWHLSNDNEWTELMKFLASNKKDVRYEEYEETDEVARQKICFNAGKYLKSKSGWKDNGNGTDEFGFSALPGGIGIRADNFNMVGDNGNLWIANEIENGSDHAYLLHMDYNSNDPSWGHGYKSAFFSVRCIQD
jgi:uncharacterized protein (TIGR02145 family)